MACFSDKSSWERLINNGMEMDFSWDNAAQQYSSLFRTSSLTIKRCKNSPIIIKTNRRLPILTFSCRSDFDFKKYPHRR